MGDTDIQIRHIQHPRCHNRLHIRIDNPNNPPNPLDKFVQPKPALQQQKTIGTMGPINDLDAGLINTGDCSVGDLEGR